MDICILHSQHSCYKGCIFIEKRGYLSKQLSRDILQLGEVESYNLVKMGCVSGAVKEYISASVCLPACL